LASRRKIEGLLANQKKMRKKEKEPREKSPQLPNAAVAFASIE